MERTFAIIKPDAVERKLAGKILARIEEAGFTVKAMRLQHLTKREAEGFYAVHRERPFFGELTDFMSSGPCVLLALEAADAIQKWRDTMGPTDPAKAAPGTLRRDFRPIHRPQRNRTAPTPRKRRVRAWLFLSWNGVSLRSCFHGTSAHPDRRVDRRRWSPDHVRRTAWTSSRRFSYRPRKLLVLLSARHIDSRQYHSRRCS
jgi:nucleoside-diphosphate kinase